MKLGSTLLTVSERFSPMMLTSCLAIIRNQETSCTSYTSSHICCKNMLLFQTLTLHWISHDWNTDFGETCPISSWWPCLAHQERIQGIHYPLTELESKYISAGVRKTQQCLQKIQNNLGSMININGFFHSRLIPLFAITATYLNWKEHLCQFHTMKCWPTLIY
jgi:hypothetical protein